MRETTSSYVTNNTAVNNGNLIIEYKYTNGILEQFTDITVATSPKVLWKLNSANEKMNVLSASLGNGMNITNTYDTADYLKTSIHNTTTTTALNLFYDFKADRGTLNSRRNSTNLYTWNETFTYDSFERLLTWTDPRGTASNTYETDGRIKTNNAVGTYNYHPTNRYRKISADLSGTGETYYNTRGKQTIAYNMFKNPISVEETNIGKATFEFNLGSSRSKTTEFNASNAVIKNKYYSGVSSVEVVELPNKSLQFITYIAGSPYDAVAALEKTYTISSGIYTPKSQEVLYLHRDYQGTILAISGNAGIIKERRQFDPWGRLQLVVRNEQLVSNADLLTSNFELLIDRGYTGHEHFLRLGFIHMNGRIYDPMLRTFMSPDPLIQNPDNSQNYNRYAYAWNNPLMYTDPSGNELITFATITTAIVIGAIIGATTYTAMQLVHGNFEWGGLAKSIVVGAVSGAATSCVGSLVSSLSVLSQASQTIQFIAKEAIRAAAHGVVQGAIAGVQGGDFGQAFVTGSLSSLAGSAFGADFNGSGEGFGFAGEFRNSIAGQSLFGSVSGGLTNHLQGGNFWEGAAMGLTIGLLNHSMNKLSNLILNGGGDKTSSASNEHPAQKAQRKARLKGLKETKALTEFFEDFAGGVNDFIETYQEMRDANLINSDKYFHSKANYKATLRGPGGEYAAKKMSNLREITDQRIKGDSRQNSLADQKANAYGRSQAKIPHANPNNYSQTIPLYRKSYFGNH